MNKNPDDLTRRQKDVLFKIENRGEMQTSHVVQNFAHLHYLSESTVWKDYERALESKNNSSKRNGLKHY